MAGSPLRAGDRRRRAMRGSDRSLVAAIRGPITLITVGVLFALNNFTPYKFHQTWPVLLIVFGLLSLLRRGTEPAGPPPPMAPGTFQPWYQTPPPPTGGYRQAPYVDSTTVPPGAPSKGGFGTTAPRSDAGQPGGTL